MTEDEGGKDERKLAIRREKEERKGKITKENRETERKGEEEEHHVLHYNSCRFQRSAF